MTADERCFFADEKPLGLILFARNCEDPDQIRALIEAFCDAVGAENLFILIDQEGGRVARLKPPHWRAFPTARAIGRLMEENAALGLEAASLLSRLMAMELYELGINVDCLPVLDIPQPGADDIIGDRAYSTNVQTAIDTGRAVAEAFLATGVLPVIKHMPGHGRAACDSHLSLPVVDAPIDALEALDFAPFKALSDLPLAMTAHVLLSQVDADAPVSASSTAIDEIIRAHIGFDGALMCDDLSMNALSGTMEERTERVLSAGCDLALHCNGDFTEMKAVAKVCQTLEGRSLARVDKAFSQIGKWEVFDQERAERLRLELLSA